LWYTMAVVGMSLLVTMWGLRDTREFAAKSATP
jgi:hypothetical protein